MRSLSVVLVGRPNVGKSTLFNRILGTRRSIVAPVAGTTRDVIEQSASWQGVRFRLTDTGGMFGASEDPLQAMVHDRGLEAIAGADVVVFLVDGREGLMPADLTIAQTVRAAPGTVLLAINKADDRRARGGALEFHELGFDPVFEVSAEHGLGIGDLLDEVVARIQQSGGAGEEPGGDEAVDTAVTVVGRPNVGKSSLVNRLLQQERMLVSDLPGTTRDAVDSELEWHRQRFRIVDTAGMRRPGRVASGGKIEAVSVLVAGRAIAEADVVVLVVDAEEGATDQDAAIAGEVDRAGRGIVIAVNKWDLVKGRGEAFTREFDERLRFQLKFLDYAPVLHVSARTGVRAPRLLALIDRVAQSRRLRVRTPQLNRFVEDVSARNPPVSPGRRHVRILYAAQIGIAPPTFVFFTNVATKFHFSYERYLVNRLRETFGFEGTPIRIQVRRRVKAKRA